MIRLLIAAVLSTAVLFAFGGWFWMVSPYPAMMIKPLPKEEELVKTLKESIPESGVYQYPFGDQEAMAGNNKAFLAKQEAGPLVHVVMRQEGFKLDAMYFATGVAQYFVSSLLMGLLLMMAAPSLEGYLARVLFVTLVGIFASVAITLQRPTWYHYPWTNPLYQAGFDAASWLLAGLVLAMVIKPNRD